MIFGAESATAVPRRQCRTFGAVCSRGGARSWALGRARRGFPTTALFALLGLLPARGAHAQSTARFADVPAVTASARAPVAPPPRALATEPVFATTPPRAIEPAPEPEAPSQPAPAAGFTRRLALNHFERAAVYEGRGDITQALREYAETISTDSTFGEAYLRLAALRERMGDAREADLIYGVAVQLGDTRAQALIRRSHLRRTAGHNAQALADLETAVELDPNRNALEELAHDYVELHAWSAALAAFRRIAKLANEAGDSTSLETARLEIRALRVLAAETDPTQERAARHDWIGRALRSIARR